MIWITRERPKVDRLACAWLIGRFVDPRAEFLFAPREQVLTEAERIGATPFDAFLAKFRLDDPALRQMAHIVRGVDTNYHDLAHETGGLEAVVLGLNATIADDHALIERSRVVFDALYAWCGRSLRPPHGLLGTLGRFFTQGRNT
jgi:hypothetical protein